MRSVPPLVVAVSVLGLSAFALAVTLVVLQLQRPPAAPTRAAPRPPPPATLTYLPQSVGEAVNGRPWITHVTLVDLDGDSLPDILAADAQSNSVRWIRQSPRGTFTEHQLGPTISGPARVDTADLNGDGKLDVLVAALGQVFPTNDRIGQVIVLEQRGVGDFVAHRVLEDVARVADVRAGDLDGDGRLDLVVGMFGYDQGGVLWLRQESDWTFSPRTVNLQSGVVHTPIVDWAGTGRPDFLALITQEYEEIHLFRHRGDGTFEDRLIWGSTNEDFGSSGLEPADVDRDGQVDLVYTNGDAFDYARPGPRPWHGIQWLRNGGAGQFTLHRVGDLAGAYAPCAADLDGNGTIDLLAVSGFNDWARPDAVSLMAWLNDGRQNFTPVVLAHRPTHLITAAVGDLDGDGVPEIVTGGLHAYPPFEHMSRVLLWRRP